MRHNMKILITGAKGFVGKNLSEVLKNIRNGKDKTRNIKIEEVFEYDLNSAEGNLIEYCKKADFVFNLAGVNRPRDSEEFFEGNCGFLKKLLETLKECENFCPVMLASSVQATCLGRYNTDYGKSKKKGEELLLSYSRETGAKALIYRFPNIFGKWSRPNYNSAVATFCNNIANDLPLEISNKNVQLELVYIDDLIEEMLSALEEKEHYENDFCFVPVSYRVTLGEIVDLLYTFKSQPLSLLMPEIPENSFSKKLYSTYLSFLPKEKASFPLKMNCNERGSFTELLKTEKCGQFSLNVSEPGVAKGQHWHNSKWELFIVVSGRGLIQQRKIGSEEVLNFEVSGDKIEAVHILPGYTHSIINLSESEKLITLMWANERFNPEKPDTFFEEV